MQDLDLIERSHQLKQNVVDFVYDAEGELAVALEKHAAKQEKREHQGLSQQNLLVDQFIFEGKVNEQTPLELFLAEQQKGTDLSVLSDSDRALIRNWQRGFLGLFEVIEVFPNGVKLMNWLTAKNYLVLFGKQNLPEVFRWQPGEILLTRIAPITETNDYWMFLSDLILKGKLGKPKLAVAIGEFKQNYPASLYADAPELRELAWESVAQYHQEFVDFFGSDRITLPGYQLNRKIQELQDKMSQKRMAAAGIDGSQSLPEIIQDRGENTAELEANLKEIGADSEELAEALKMIKTPEKAAMKLPKTNLPEEIQKAEIVTVFSHPRWGQMLIPTYSKFQAMLTATATENYPHSANSTQLVDKYLKDPEINYFIWQQLQQEYPQQLEKLLQVIFNNPDFNLERDLAPTLTKFNKPLEPELPEIASVPQHLHDLFAEAFIQVNKSQTKSKKTAKKKKGFQS